MLQLQDKTLFRDVAGTRRKIGRGEEEKGWIGQSIR